MCENQSFNFFQKQFEQRDGRRWKTKYIKANKDVNKTVKMVNKIWKQVVNTVLSKLYITRKLSFRSFMKTNLIYQ